MKKEDARTRYDAKNTKQYKLKLNLNTDKDIIGKLADVNSMQGYIKELIRRDLKLPLYLHVILWKVQEGFDLKELHTDAENIKELRSAELVKTGPATREVTNAKLSKTSDGSILVEINGEPKEIYTTLSSGRIQKIAIMK